MFVEHIFRDLPYLKILPLICLLFIISPSNSDEIQFLLNFKSALQNPNSHVFDTWTTGNSVCNFTGVVCDADQQVKEINLSDQNLSGSMPFESLCSLQSLERISLGTNFLHGIISDHLRNCTKLQYLDLGQNSFSGPVPDLSTLSQLSFLNLNHSGFSGEFPWKSLEKLTSLTFLSLGDNPFDSTLFPPELTKLDKLYWLYLSNCSLGGEIPVGIGNLTLLENLELSDNHMSGEIPPGITRLSNLRQLELYNNRITGKLPVGFGKLTSLINFDASTNDLEGDLSELKALTQLKSLQLFENRFAGEIPAEFGDFKNLREFSLYRNRITGTLPQKIGSWADFLYIDVSENFLTGPVPPDMCKNGKMTDLLILQNNFTGGLPENYASCSSLVRLRVNNNTLSGEIPSGIWSLPHLIIIDLTLNQFEGPITSNIGDSKSLSQIFLGKNRFSGKLPTRISETSSLVAINLSSNQFSGQIPKTIGQLKKLSSLHLENNQFSGDLPESLGSCFSLSDLNIAANSISGKIPDSLGSLPSLNSLNLSDNQLSGEIPARLTSLKLTVLDFSNNRLMGKIPESLSIGAFSGSFAGNPGLCSQSIINFRRCSPDSSKPSELKTVILCFIAGAIALVVLLACFFYLRFKQTEQEKENPIKRNHSWDTKRFHVLTFGEDEIVNAVKQENLIGKGGSGNVYKVVLLNGQQLAVKHIWKSDSGDRKTCRSTSAILAKGKSRSPEYDAEVATLSSIRHINVVKLYCSITSEDSNLLVYEYMPNGSLWDQLHSPKKMKMDWWVRYEIAVGAGRGLEYLHHGCDRPVIHRDVKSSNILLDEHMKPRIADFGLAKIVQSSGLWDSSHIIAGTHGYIAPEYAYTSKVNEKSDVYSFGVVLMELVTGKNPIEPEFGENTDIVQWICREMMINKKCMIDLVDSTISESFKEDAVKVLRIAIRCTTRTPALRPTMRTVVHMLEEVEPYTLTGIVVNKQQEVEKWVSE